MAILRRSLVKKRSGSGRRSYGLSGKSDECKNRIYHKNKYILSLINARNDNYYIGFYDNNYNDVINEHFGNIEEVNDIINKYNDVLVVSNNSDIDNVKVINELDIKSIYNYYKDSEKVNPHMVLPNYLKLPQVLEKNV